MKWPWQRKALSINQVIDRLESILMPKSGVVVDPETCMRAPTVHAIVTAVSRRVAVSPIAVMKKTVTNGKTTKEVIPDHDVTRLLNAPNPWQNKVGFWLDMTSQLLRYGNLVAYKSRGRTGPVRRLIPLNAGETEAKLSDSNELTYQARVGNEALREYPPAQILHARGPARDFLNGDSPITDIKEAVGLEIAAEQYGATFFGNGAIPLLVFELVAGFKDFKTDEEKKEFLAGVKDTLGGDHRHKAFLLPKGMQLSDTAKTAVQNNQAQFIESRKYQRTVIAGAFGVPPHLVGDLERATFNNVEQQDSDFTINVVLPYVRMIEAALERDLLSPQERNQGTIIRFNLDAIQRADFKSRQEGLQIMRLNGIVSADEWREFENMNPLKPDQGGDDYWAPANYTLPVTERDESEGDPNAPGNPDNPIGTEGDSEPPD